MKRACAATMGLLVLAAAPAAAETLNIFDPKFDALAVTTTDVLVGDFDIDLTNVLVDHGTRDLKIQAKFNKLAHDSWHYLTTLVDTNGDWAADYEILWGMDERAAAVFNARTGDVLCTDLPISLRTGSGGTATVTAPRTCFNKPAAVAVHVIALWSGWSQAGTELHFVDTAPGPFDPDFPEFSARVRSSNTGTATSPAPAKVRTKMVASLTRKKQRVGKAPSKVTFRVKSGKRTSGKVVVRVAGKKWKTVKVTTGKRKTVKLPKHLKPGKHKVKLKFTPKNPKRFIGSSKTVKVRVVR